MASRSPLDVARESFRAGEEYLRHPGAEKSLGNLSGAALEPGTPDYEARLAELVESSPFLDTGHPLDGYEILKLVLMAPVALLRFLLIYLIVFIAALACKIALIGVDPKVGMSHEAASRVRAVILWLAKASVLIAGMGPLPVRGKEHLAEAEKVRAVVAINHESYLDALVLMSVLAPTGVAKSSVARTPGVGAICRALGFVFVARRGTSDVRDAWTLPAGQDPIKALERAAGDDRFGLLFVAPEGTTKASQALLKFKRGAFSTGHPVLPMLIRYKYAHHAVGWGCWRSTPFHVFRTLAQFCTPTEVVFLPVQRMQEDETPEAFAQRVRELMGRELPCPLVDQGITEERMILRSGYAVTIWGDRVARFPVPEKKPKKAGHRACANTTSSSADEELPPAKVKKES